MRHLATFLVVIVVATLLAETIRRLHWTALVETVTAGLGGWLIGAGIAAVGAFVWPPRGSKSLP